MEENQEEKTKFPRHIENALIKRRDDFICWLNSEGYSLPEIGFILKTITRQRINQIIIKNRAKKLTPREGEK